jgi:flagellar hook-associated protein FlgK
MQVLHTEHADKVTQLQHETVTKVKEINDLKASLDTHGKQIVDLKADLESHGKQIEDLLDQLANEKTVGATKA